MIIQLKKGPGGYGLHDLSAIDFVTKVELGIAVLDTERVVRQDVLVGGEVVGQLLTWHGNGGKSWKIANQAFCPAEGVFADFVDGEKE